MGIFSRKREAEPQAPVDHRSKRGGVRRATQQIQVDLSDLEKPAAAPRLPAAAPAGLGGPPAMPTGRQAAAPARGAPSARTTARVPSPVEQPHAAVTGRSARISGRTGTPIGELMIEAAAINTEQLTNALRIQARQGGLVGQILVEMGACQLSDVAAALGKQVRFTQVDLNRFKPRLDALLLIPPDKCRELRLIPFELLEDNLCCAMVNVLNRKAITQVESLTKLRAKGFKSTLPAINAAIDKYYTQAVQECAAKVSTARLEEKGDPTGLARQLAVQLSGTAKQGAAAKDVKARTLAADEESKKYVKYIQAAEALIAQGKLDDALGRLEAGESLAPAAAQKVIALRDKVRQQLEERRRTEAERLAKVAQLLQAGRAARDAGKLDAALASFQEARTLDHENSVVARELASVQKTMARVKAERAAKRKAAEEARAAEERRQAEDKAKRDAQVAELMALAEAARADGRLDQAEFRLQDVLALAPDNVVAKQAMANVRSAVTQAEQQRKARLAAVIAEAREMTARGGFEEALGRLRAAAEFAADDPTIAAEIHNVEATARLREKEEAARRHREVEEAAKIQEELRALLAAAGQAREAGALEEAEQKLEDALALAPENAEVHARLGEVRAAVRKKIEGEETQRRAQEERRRRKARVHDVLRSAAEDREAGRFEMAMSKLRSLAEESPGQAEVDAAIATVEEDIERRRIEEEERLRSEEDERRRSEDELRRRVAVAAEADAERRRMEYVSGGTRRVEAGTVSEESLVELALSPENARPNVAAAIMARTGTSETEEDALKHLPVAQTYARSREELRRMVEAADEAAEAIEVALGEEFELELEPEAEAGAPMPKIEEALEAEPEAILDALPAEEGDTVEGEFIESLDMLEDAGAAEERLAAVPLSEEEFAVLRNDLEPDPVFEWWMAHAAAGPVPAALVED